MKLAQPTVVFHYPVFNIGGAEMSILRMTKFLVEHGWTVELVLSTGGGLLECRVDSKVKITHLREKVVSQRFLKEKKLLRKLLWLIIDSLPYMYSRVQWITRAFRFLFRRYDAAVISLHGLSPSFCCRWVQSKKKIQWIRNDLARCDPDSRARKYIYKFDKYIDHYVCVSKTAYESLIQVIPSVKDKALIMYNILNSQEIVEKQTGQNPYLQYVDALKVVTICRLSDQAKGLFRMLAVHERLRDLEIPFFWFVIGDGPDREKLKQAVVAKGLEKSFILIGSQNNPFPYYHYADISASLSYYEGLCGSVNEAKLMGKPVIATRFSGIEEQIIHGVNGLIVENDEDAIFEGLKSLLTDSELRAMLTNNILPKDITDDDYKLSILRKLCLD